MSNPIKIRNNNYHYQENSVKNEPNFRARLSFRINLKSRLLIS